MNITDIDDKIIVKARNENKSWTDLSNHYLSSFLKDLHSLNILPFNAYVSVTGQIENIIKYIQTLESNGLAYVNEKTGDIELDSSKIDFELDHFKTESSYPGRRSGSDFTLWKSYKPNEPYWEYTSKSNNQTIKGRPGWHVECSTISQTTLGNRIDFHFGGHDLLFPHHVNESRCCKAMNLINYGDQLKNESIHKWSSQWLHFGSLKINESKMSKSLNNFIQIKKFLEKNSKNILRILCIIHPYRRGRLAIQFGYETFFLNFSFLTDITFDEGNLINAEEQNLKIVNFYQLLNDRKSKLIGSSKLKFKATEDLDQLVQSFNRKNLAGLADDFDMNSGWQCLVELIGHVNKNIELWTLYDLLKLELIINDYMETMGLSFQNSTLSTDRNPNDQLIIQKLIEYRKEVRTLLLDELVNSGSKSKNLESMIKLTDKVRDKLASNHLIVRDEKFVKKK